MPTHERPANVMVCGDLQQEMIENALIARFPVQVVLTLEDNDFQMRSYLIKWTNIP